MDNLCLVCIALCVTDANNISKIDDLQNHLWETPITQRNAEPEFSIETKMLQKTKYRISKIDKLPIT